MSILGGTMRKPNLMLVIALLLVCRSVRADRSLHSINVNVAFQNPTYSTCALIGVDGTPTATYTTAAREGNVFTFSDPLPTGAILNYMTVSMPTMASCQPSDYIDLTLNNLATAISRSYSDVS